MADSSKPTVDLEDIRHDLTAVIGTLETVIKDLRPRITGAAETFELYDLGMKRLRQVLEKVDAALEEST